MKELTQSYIKERLDYDPLSGALTWRRCDSMPNWWNAKMAGKVAGGDFKEIYKRVRIDGTRRLQHRVIFLWMTGEVPEEVDHINHNTLDNRWANLRCATRTKNSRNMSLYKKNKTGNVGVAWNEDHGRWVAYISRCHLGSYSDYAVALHYRQMGERKFGYHENHGN